MQQAAKTSTSAVSPLARFQEWLKSTWPATSVRHGCLVDPGEYERDIDDLRNEFSDLLPALSFDLDVSEMLFGEARKVSRLPVSAHRIVREVLDEFFAVGGCYAQSSKTAFTFVLPNPDREIGAMKHDAIKVELERRLRAETDSKGVKAANLSRAQKRDKELTDMFTRALAKMVPGEDQASTEIELSRLPWGLVCRYSPMWLVRNKLLTSYVCRAMREAEGGGVQPSSLALEQTTDPAATTQLDLPMLAQASRDLEDLIVQKQSAIVVVPVHFMTISRRPYSDMFLKYCETIPEDCRRFLVLEIVGVPATLPEFRLRELLQYLKKYCRSMLIRVGPNLKTFRNSKLWA